MGEASSRETGGAFSPTRCADQKEANESRNQSEVVGQVEGVLEGQENRQEIIREASKVVVESEYLPSEWCT
jgi:hypothetical protein